MAPEELLKWARIAAEAAGYNPLRDVMILPGEEDGRLKIISIGNYELGQTRFADGAVGWHSGDDTHYSLVDGLAEMLSQACFKGVEQALMGAGLKWEGEG